MTNDQIPMTNEKENDQFANNQLNRGKGRTDRLYRFLFWLLVIVRLSGYWNLVIGHYLLHRLLSSSVITVDKYRVFLNNYERLHRRKGAGETGTATCARS
jgi:hypothetical protein